MRSRFLLLVPALLLFAAPLVSCSKGNEAEPEKGAIDQMTDRAAKEIGDKIRTPMDKARAAQGIQADRDSVIDEKVDKKTGAPKTRTARP